MAAATLTATLGRVGDHCLFGLEQHCKIKKKILWKIQNKNKAVFCNIVVSQKLTNFAVFLRKVCSRIVQIRAHDIELRIRVSCKKYSAKTPNIQVLQNCGIRYKNLPSSNFRSSTVLRRLSMVFWSPAATGPASPSAIRFSSAPEMNILTIIFYCSTIPRARMILRV